MNISDVINSVTERAKETANVRVVFGDPIDANGLTIIPVASVKVSGGGGGGSGSGVSASSTDASDVRDVPDDSAGEGGGMGLGLQVIASPIGYIEVQDGEAKFVDIIDKNKLAVGGLVVGGLLVLTAAKLLSWKIKHRS